MISPIFYNIRLRSPEIRPRLAILDAQSGQNYEVVIPNLDDCAALTIRGFTGLVGSAPGEIEMRTGDLTRAFSLCSVIAVGNMLNALAYRIRQTAPQK
jgi:hypothetical protein